jgi:hypothetical protein
LFIANSTVGSRYTALERKSVLIPKNFLPVFIGIILSDANISRSYKADARLQFKQTTINHIEYLYFIFFKLSHDAFNPLACPGGATPSRGKHARAGLFLDQNKKIVEWAPPPQTCGGGAQQQI